MPSRLVGDLNLTLHCREEWDDLSDCIDWKVLSLATPFYFDRSLDGIRLSLRD
jgi:hypothetical protein